MLFAIVASLSSCSVYMAAHQASQKDLSVLRPGTPRSAVIASLGRPKSSRLIELQRIDLFEFTQGYTKEVKVGRAFVHGTADLATGGLWELAGTPAEAVFSGKKMSFQITYDNRDCVEIVNRVKIED